MQAKLACAIFGALLAFGTGWKVNGWRLNSAFNAQAAEAAQQVNERIKFYQDQVELANAATVDRESELLTELDTVRAETEILRDEIENRPTIRIEKRIPVAGECPVCVVVDWDRFGMLYNAAATGGAPAAPESETGGRDATVPGITADASRRSTSSL